MRKAQQKKGFTRVVAINGGHFENKGAELMLVAVVERMRRMFPETRLVVDTGIGPYASRAALGLFQLFTPERHGRLGRLVHAVTRAGYRSRYGLVLDREVDGIIDVSGFALGDALKDRHMLAMASAFEEWRKQGKWIVMLPQAFGPFTRAVPRECAGRAISCCSLVFARDESSFSHVESLNVKEVRLEKSPDFTVETDGTGDPCIEMSGREVVIVPNAQMARSDVAGSSYVEWLGGVARELLSKGLAVRLLYHETQMDPSLIGAANTWAGLPVPVVSANTAKQQKWVLGRAGAVLSSRYHATVSALSQGVPCLGTSWSHKYPALYADYGVSDWLISANEDARCVASRLEMAMAQASKHRLALLDRARAVRDKTAAMWQTVADVIGRTAVHFDCSLPAPGRAH